MKTFLRIILVILFVIATPNLILLLAGRTSGISATSIKRDFAEKEIYQKIIDELNKSIDTPIGGLTVSYLQEKTEKLIDDIDLWVKGKGSSPSISFVDLDAKTIDQLKQLSGELKKEGAGEFDFDRFIENGLSFPVGEQITFLKTLYWWVTYGLFILIAGMAGAVAGIFYFGENMVGKLKWTGATLLIGALWGLPGVIVAAAFSLLLSRGLAASYDIPAFLAPMIDTLAAPLLSKYLVIGIGVIILFVAASIVLFMKAKSH